jgi:hypothetical protein
MIDQILGFLHLIPMRNYEETVENASNFFDSNIKTLEFVENYEGTEGKEENDKIINEIRERSNFYSRIFWKKISDTEKTLPKERLEEMNKTKKDS